MATCPICRRAPATPKYKPFCSKRCADIDLQRWFTGGYAIPAEPADDLPDDPGEEV
ncbi:DNA gyrase inhibitor YacG [Brevundimonas sp.]|uniref:DNA gyrase inhibitor YacG n=1 Tax=Brevundimonas sp. TaxID=1871086 RepID=UPI003918A381